MPASVPAVTHPAVIRSRQMYLHQHRRPHLPPQLQTAQIAMHMFKTIAAARCAIACICLCGAAAPLLDAASNFAYNTRRPVPCICNHADQNTFGCAATNVCFHEFNAIRCNGNNFRSNLALQPHQYATLYAIVTRYCALIK